MYQDEEGEDEDSNHESYFANEYPEEPDFQMIINVKMIMIIILTS